MKLLSNKRNVAALAVGLAVLALACPAWGQGRIIVGGGRGRPILLPPGGAGGAVAPGKDIAGLHIPQTNAINMSPYVFTDSGGFRWDLYNTGYISSGTNNVYCGAMQIQINNNGFGGTNRGFLNKDGDELEVGPFNVSNVVYSRRVKVYKDAPLARWMDIFENPAAQDVSLTIHVYYNHNWPIGSVTTSSNTNAFGQDDWAMATTFQQGPNNLPAVLHVFCDRKSKVRPQIQTQNAQQVHATYTITVPAKGTAILCSFESQGNLQDHVKFMAAFKGSKYLRDLPQSVRRLVVNYSSGTSFSGVDLERLPSADNIVLTRGDLILGTITNDSFTVDTFFGQIKVPAKQVIGMAPGATKDDPARVLLADGEIISGKIAEPKLLVSLPTGSNLQVPLESIKQWAYRVSEDRPEDVSLSGPVLLLRTGDQLSFDPKAFKLDFRTRHGMLTLNGQDLMDISMDNPGNAIHRATFTNGSILAGFIEPETLVVPIKLGSKLQLPRDLIFKIVFSTEEKPDPVLTRVLLSNDDELFGRLDEAELKVTTEFGEVKAKPRNIKTMKFNPTHPEQVALQLWDGSQLRGTLQQKELGFQVAPGPTLKLPTSQIAGFTQSETMPPDEMLKQVEKAVARLGAESYRDRQAATDELVKLGPGIVPCLRKYLKDNDAEVRVRINSVIEKLGGAPKEQLGNPVPPGAWGVFE